MGLQLESSSWEVFSKLVIMYKLFAVSCLAAAALAAPNPDPQVLVGAAPVAGPAVVAPALAPNCKIAYEAIPTQSCTPRAENVCKTHEIEHQGVEYEKVCKEVTSRHCGAPGSFLYKREAEAEADPQFYAGVHPYHVPAAVATVKQGCHETVSEHCVDSPKVVSKVVPYETCHITQVVDCVETEQQVAKTVCEPVEHQVVTRAGGFYHPFAYNHPFIVKK